MPIIKREPCGEGIELSPDKAPGASRYSDPAMTPPKINDGQRAAKHPDDATCHRYAQYVAKRRKRAFILIGNKASVFAVALAVALLLTNTFIPASHFSDVKKPIEAGNYGGASAALAEEVNPVTVSPLAGRNTIAAGVEHTVGLRNDGTVVAVGADDYGQCEVSGWTDIVAVAAKGWHTVGLRGDGTVVAAGYNDFGECEVSDWTDIWLPGDLMPLSAAGNPADTEMESGKSETDGVAGQQQPDDAYPAEPTPEPSYEPAAEEPRREFVMEFIAGTTQAPTSTPAAVEPEEEVILPWPVEDQADGEAALRQLLRDQTGKGATEFFYADYDGNGTNEAFALLGEPNDYGGYSGDIWFVNASGATCIQQGLSYFKLEMMGNTPTMIFHAEENYGGSGSTSHTWMVEGDNPKEVNQQVSGDLEWAGGNDYYGYPSAFDMDDDGTGHTWKRYYFYMDGGQLREYGGINISLDELLEFDGAAELIDAKLAEGYSVGSVIYRANGVINVNLDRGSQNANLSLRYDDTGVQYWEEDGGVYLTASDPSIAVYPEGFVHPVGTGSTADALIESPPASTEAPPLRRGYVSWYDLDGDGSMERFLLYKEDADGEYGREVNIRLNIADVDGNVLADGIVYAYEEFEGPDWRYFVYNLGNGRIYVQVQVSLDGTSDDFEFFRMEGGDLVMELHLIDPGMSDASAIYVADTDWERYTDEEIYYSEGVYDKGGPEYVSALNRYMESYGYSFVGHDGGAYIDVPDSQLICVATALQIDPDGPKPSEYTAFSDSDASPAMGSDMPASVLPPQTDTQTDLYDTDASPRSAYTTGDVNLRDGPGLDYASLTVIPGGNYVEYLNEEAVDERGVTWYHVSWAGTDGWGSSKYIILE